MCVACTCKHVILSSFQCEMESTWILHLSVVQLRLCVHAHVCVEFQNNRCLKSSHRQDIFIEVVIRILHQIVCYWYLAYNLLVEKCMKATLKIDFAH
jgi:hypothetical protein